jgi:cytochrome c oxidase subunit II
MTRNLPRAFAIAAAACSASLAFAAYDVNIPPPATSVAHQIFDLHWGIIWVCIGIFVVVFGAMFWSLLHHRKSAGAKAAHFHENTTVEIIWTIVPFVILVGMAYPATKTVLDMKDAGNPDMSVKITAYQWKWEYDYLQDGVRFYSSLSTPRDQIEEYSGKGAAKGADYLLEVDRPLVVPVGKKVRLLVTASDVIHGWYVPTLGVNQYGIPGFVKDAWIRVDKPGVYRGQCSQICGKEHGYMPIVVVAKAPAEYDAWFAEQKTRVAAAAAPKTDVPVADVPAKVAAAAPAPTAADANRKLTIDELKAKGGEVFAANCVACHQATGKGLPPAFPPLDGSKLVTGPKAAQIALVLGGKAGTAMASFSRLSDAELAAVITYTRNSWGNKTGEAIQPAEIKAARK